MYEIVDCEAMRDSFGLGSLLSARNFMLFWAIRLGLPLDPKKMEWLRPFLRNCELISLAVERSGRLTSLIFWGAQEGLPSEDKEKGLS